MKAFFLSIFDALSGKKGLAAAGVLAVLALCAVLASRMHYAEDISEFLPSDPASERYSEVYNALSEKGNIVVLFRADTTDQGWRYSVEDAMDSFEENWAAADSTGLVPSRQIRTDASAALGLMSFVGARLPYFLTEDDYRRADSLLNIPGYVRQALEDDRQTLMFVPSDMVAGNIQGDPLRLFTPVLQRLRSTAGNDGYEVSDGYLFSRGVGIGFMTSAYGSSESGMNSRVASLVDEVIAATEASNPSVRVSAVGPGLIAAGNASRIKHDSVIAGVIALLLICLLLALTYRRFSSIAWIFATTAAGWVAAVALMSLFKDSMSVIVLGVGTIIIGIAINYPLHYIDGLRGGVPRRQNLEEMVPPLLIGNVTTVAAFLSLLLMDARAMRDLGLFWSLLLMATILFTLIVLPLFLKPGQVAGGTGIEVGKILPDRVPSSKWLFFGVLAVTAVMFFLSRGTSFDSDLQHINYMTPGQRSDMAFLAGTGPSGGENEIYAVCEAEDLESAVRLNEELMSRLESLPKGSGISRVNGVGDFLHTREYQQVAVSRWKEFWSSRSDAVLSELRTEAAALGFSPGAFAPFENAVNAEWEPLDAEHFQPVIDSYKGTYILDIDGRKCLVNRVYGDVGPSALREACGFDGQGDGSSRVLIFDGSDVGNQLVNVMRDSFDWIGSICSLVVFIFLLLTFRRLEISLLAFLPLAFSWWWILGLMRLGSMEFNVVNVILATFIFGQGDDYTIFTTEGLIYEYAYGRKRFATYKDSIVHSALIMFIGIGALIVARHPAMRSLAEVTLVGMVVVLLMAYYLPPVIFRWLTTRDGEPRQVPITAGRLLRSLGAICFFLVMMFLFVYPVTFFWFLFGGRSEESKTRYHVFLQKIANFIATHVPGVRFRMRQSLEEVQPLFSEPAVVICNHQSHLDLMCLMMLSPKLVFFTNRTAWNNPLYSYVLRKAEYMPVGDDLSGNIEKIRDLVSRGYSPVVFPEGTRTLTGKPGRFHKGAFYLAEELGLDILPVFIHGAWHVLPKQDFMLRKGEMSVEIGRRMKPSGDYRQDTKDFSRFFKTRYEEICRELETPAYLRPYVLGKYIYKGASVEATARRALAHVEDVPWLHDGSLKPEDGAVAIRGCGQGELAWIYALMHPQTEVYATDPDPDNIAIASHCSHIPANLHFSVEETTENQ